MVANIRARLRGGWRAVIRQRFWVLVGLAGLAGVAGDAWVRGWWPHARPFLAAWWPWLLIGAAAAAIVLRLSWALWWWLPKQQVDRLRLTDAQARADVEDNFRKTAGQLLGGAAVLIGAGIAYVQFTEQQRNSQRQFDLQQQNSQLSKGFELLANATNISQLLGGIYVLEGVMNTSEQYHKPVLEALSAFVRTETGEKANSDPQIEVALTVIGRRGPGPGTVNLVGAHLPNATLVGDFSYADLSNADLSNADLSHADLLGALLHKTDLRGAKGLTRERLRGMCGDENTELDDSVKPDRFNCPRAVVAPIIPEGWRVQLGR